MIVNDGGEYFEKTKMKGFVNELEVWETFNVTDIIKDHISSPIKNYGFIIKYMDASVNTGTVSYSSEYTEIAKRPKLTIYYR